MSLPSVPNLNSTPPKKGAWAEWRTIRAKALLWQSFKWIQNHISFRLDTTWYNIILVSSLKGQHEQEQHYKNRNTKKNKKGKMNRMNHVNSITRWGRYNFSAKTQIWKSQIKGNCLPKPCQNSGETTSSKTSTKTTKAESPLSPPNLCKRLR